MSTAADNALGWVQLLFQLGIRVADAVGKGDYERVARILPEHLRTTLERQLADDAAREKFASRGDATVPTLPTGTGEGHQ